MVKVKEKVKKIKTEDVVEKIEQQVVEPVVEPVVEEVAEQVVVEEIIQPEVAQPVEIQTENVVAIDVDTNGSAFEQENQEKTDRQERLGGSSNEDILKNLSVFANLLSTSVRSLEEEFYFLQIAKIMSRLQKVIVRYDVTEKELETLFYGAGQCSLGGITVAPAYLPSSIKQNKKNSTGKQNITSLIDFPFGESSLKGKVVNIKESIKIGANSVAVTVPSMMLKAENLKLLKKECRKYLRYSKKNAGIVLNASDVTEENFAAAIKALKKTKISYIILAFGDATIEEVKAKLALVNKNGKDKKLFILANVDKVESASELFRLGVDSVLTPYADDIGSDLLKRFKLISK